MDTKEQLSIDNAHAQLVLHARSKDNA